MDRVVKIQDLSRDEGKTYREIEESLGVSSKTISKALHHPEDFVEGYRRQAPSPRPALGAYVERIEELLKGKDWAREKGRVVRRTARWVYRKIRKEGYAGAESTVRSFVRQRLKQPRAACPIEHLPGDEVQFDFGHYRVKIADRVEVVHFVGASFPYSTRRFLFAYPAERQECLFDAMERTYALSGGISCKATLDNTGLAVKRVLEGRKREETEEYKRFRAVLGVQARYTNRAAGWEKGHVEGTVGWAKRQVLLDLEVASWEELSKVLREACEEDGQERLHRESGKRVQENFEEERSFLQPLRYEGRRSYKRVRAQVSPGGLVHVDGSRYSVPIRLRGHTLRVRLYADQLVVTFNHEEVARYPRDWSGRGEHYRVEHYLELLRRAPALLDHGKPFSRMPEWLQKTRAALGDDKSLVELLLAVDSQKYTMDELKRACDGVLNGRCVTRAVIEQRALLERSGSSEVLQELEEQECCGLGHHRFAIESPAMYDEILRVDRDKEVG